jgi:hypothetical protein
MLVFCLSLEWFGTKIKFEIEIKISTETLAYFLRVLRPVSASSIKATSMRRDEDHQMILVG